MTGPTKSDPPRVVSNEEYEAYMVNGPLADAWDEFILNGDSAALARYLRLGGDVTPQVRDALITYLEAHPRKEIGGSKKFRDWELAVHVQGELLKDKLANLARKKDGLEPIKVRTVRKILQEYAGKNNAELRTVEKQYERGRKVFQKLQRSAPETPE
jgi:hypothetical protein